MECGRALRSVLVARLTFYLASYLYPRSAGAVGCTCLGKRVSGEVKLSVLFRMRQGAVGVVHDVSRMLRARGTLPQVRRNDLANKILLGLKFLSAWFTVHVLTGSWIHMQPVNIDSTADIARDTTRAHAPFSNATHAAALSVDDADGACTVGDAMRKKRYNFVAGSPFQLIRTTKTPISEPPCYQI